MNKVFTLAPKEDWIVDRFVREWNADNGDIATDDIVNCDVIWLAANWCWSQVPRRLLSDKKVIQTVHHIVPEKFGQAQLEEFRYVDQVTDVYHVPNKHTEAFIRPLTQKSIHVINYWANDKIWKKTGDRAELRKKYGIPHNVIAYGSFQRDTEGSSIASGNFVPKLEKGPDLLADYFESHKRIFNTPGSSYVWRPHVVLAGWRRQYLTKRLDEIGIPYSYFEKPSQEVINELYQTLDLYPVTARCEGGPQSLIECGLLEVKCISRDIGIASAVLPSYSIGDNIASVGLIPSVPNVEHLRLPMGYEPYRKLIESL